MDMSSGLILHLEIGDSRQVERKNNRLEGFLFENGLQCLQVAGLHVTEVITDASRTVIALLGRLCA